MDQVFLVPEPGVEQWTTKRVRARATMRVAPMLTPRTWAALMMVAAKTEEPPMAGAAVHQSRPHPNQ